MTRKRFWQEPYRTVFTTYVTAVDGPAVTVAETIFFAFSGGQESDAGTIGGQPVVAARKDGLAIVYTLPADHGLQAGERVDIVIDGERRYRLMRLHFAAELILELAYQTLGPIAKLGAHIGSAKARIDFAWPQPLTPHFPELLARAQALVAADLPIVSAFADEAREERYWQIEGFARVPCGGTHPARTGEVGDLRLKRKNIGRDKERIEIFVDARPAPPHRDAPSSQDRGRVA